MRQNNFLLGIAYEIWDSESFSDDIPQEKGWEVPYVSCNIEQIIEYSNVYNIMTNDRSFETRHFWDNEYEPQVDEMTGSKTFYKMFIKHLDGSDLSSEENLVMNELIAQENDNLM